MCPKSILCLFNGETFETDMLEVAMDLSVRFGAQLRCLQVCLPLETYPELCAVVLYGRAVTGDGPTLDTLAEANKAGREAIEAAIADAARLHRLPFDKATHTRPPPSPHVTFAALTGGFNECLPCEGRVSDLILAGKTDGDANLEAITTCLFMTGRPVMVVPPFSGKPRLASKPSKIHVAWDGSLEAARALSHALPLCDASTHMELLCVEEHGTLSKFVNRDGVLAWLACHGIEPLVTTLAHPGKSVGECLLDRCETDMADLLVMGAYGHSHVREMLLGGTTDHVLRHGRVPLLVAN